MSTIETTGYLKDVEGVYIPKDPSAELTYTLEWADWLPAGTSIASVNYALQVRANDPSPLVREAQGISGTKTYVTLSGGGASKVYNVAATITLDNSEVERRAFRVKVENRSV